MCSIPTVSYGDIDFLIKTHKPDPSFQEAFGKVMTETIEKILPVANQLGVSLEGSVAIIEKMNQQTTIMPNPFEIKFLLPDSTIWESTNRHYADEVEAIRAALLYSENRPEHIVGVFSALLITKIRNGEPIRIYEGHEGEVLAALGSQNPMIDDMFYPTYEQQDVFEESDSENQSGQLIGTVEFPEPIQCNLGDEITISHTFKSCPDCKDGFYYPFVGLKEPCRTCK